MAATASLSMLEEEDDDLDLYKQLAEKHKENRDKIKARHESFPTKEAPDIIQDDPELMPEVDDYDGNNGGSDGSGHATSDDKTEYEQAEVIQPGSAARDRVWGKHFPKVYSRGVKMVTGFAYKKLVEPKNLREERDNLYKMMGTSLFTKEDGQRLKNLDDELKQWAERRKEAIEAGNIEDEDAKAIGELSSDLMRANGKEISPGVLLLILLLIPVFNTTAICVTHFFQYRWK
jgi:hypothetical protein